MKHARAFVRGHIFAVRGSVMTAGKQKSERMLYFPPEKA